MSLSLAQNSHKTTPKKPPRHVYIRLLCMYINSEHQDYNIPVVSLEKLPILLSKYNKYTHTYTHFSPLFVYTRIHIYNTSISTENFFFCFNKNLSCVNFGLTELFNQREKKLQQCIYCFCFKKCDIIYDYNLLRYPEFCTP